MSEPDEFIVKDRNKRCRGCGKHNTSLCRTANNYDFPQIKYFTAYICSRCRSTLKLVISLLSFLRILAIVFLIKNNKSVFFIMFALEPLCT